MIEHTYRVLEFHTLLNVLSDYASSPLGKSDCLSLEPSHDLRLIENEQKLDVASMFSRPGASFVLQVRGDSMIDEQIRDGDFVIVQPNAEPKNGQTVVALLPDGEVTLKQFYREGRRIRLQPANQAYEPMYVPAGKLTVQGVVVGVLRKYS